MRNQVMFPAMFTAIGSRTGTLLSGTVVLAGAAALYGGAAAAEGNQDDQFLALLDSAQIPAVANVPSVIASGHKVCRKLDAGMPVDAIVEEMTGEAYARNPAERLYPHERVTRTYQRFVTAAVQAYCPYDQGKIASIMAYSAVRLTMPMHEFTGYRRNTVDSAIDMLEPPNAVGMIMPPATWQGEITPTNPPKIPPLQGLPPPRHVPSVPPRQVEPPPRQVPPAPQQVDPPPEKVLPPPEQVLPPPEQVVPLPDQTVPAPQQAGPPAASQPGGAPGSGGGDNGGGGSVSGGKGSGGDANGGGVPEKPSPAELMPPGFVRLAP